MFKNKTLLITGGTGSFGNAVLSKFLKSDIKEIRIFSRDEKNIPHYETEKEFEKNEKSGESRAIKERQKNIFLL